MIYLAILLFIPLIASRNINDLEIHNGQDAFDGEFPYMVSIRNFRNHICGGSLIGPSWVLTAAHCLREGCPMKFQILYDSLDSFNEVDVPWEDSFKLINVKRYIIHDEFKLGFFHYDVGLIELEKNVFLYPWQYVQLPNTPISILQSLTVAGWGIKDEKIQRRLQKADLTLYGDTKCQFDPAFHSISQLCAWSSYSRPCQGDSGGPFVYNNVQYGIVSYGLNCTHNVPSIFANVTAVRSWIRQHTKI